MANLITLLRFLLLFLLVGAAYRASPALQLANAPLLLIMIGLDGLDGYVARRRNETSNFGAIFDIAVDRLVEYVLWVVLADIGLVPIWAVLVFVVRGTLVDSIRYAAIAEGESAFGMMRSQIGRFLVASRFMRGLYGAVKAVTFAWLLLLQPLPLLLPDLWAWLGMEARILGAFLIYLSVLLCLLRGLPVIAEFVVAQAPSLRRRPLRR